MADELNKTPEGVVISDETMSDFLSDEVTPEASVEPVGEITPVEPVVEVKTSVEEPTDGKPAVIEPITPVANVEPSVTDGPSGDNKVVTLSQEAYDKMLTLIDSQAGKAPVKAEAVTSTPPSVIAGLDTLFEGVDFDSVMESKENFVDFMKKYGAAVQEQTRQSILTAIPDVVGTHVSQRASMQDAATAFYSQYPELKRVKRYVGAVANEVHAENPDWTMKQIFEETAKRAKENLNLQAAVIDTNKANVIKPKPTLPGNTSVKVPASAPKGLQDEIADLMSDF